MSTQLRNSVFHPPLCIEITPAFQKNDHSAPMSRFSLQTMEITSASAPFAQFVQAYEGDGGLRDLIVKPDDFYAEVVGALDDAFLEKKACARRSKCRGRLRKVEEG